MASNKTTVNYNKIKISFSENLVKLHRVALENADRVNSLNLNLLNTLVDDPDKKDGDYNPILMVRKKDGEDIPDSEKRDVLKYIQEYVKYFVGEDESKLIKVDDLKPIINPVDGSLSSTSGDISSTSSVSESDMSFISFLDRKITESVNFIFESKEEKTQKGFAVDYVLTINNKKTNHLPKLSDKIKASASGMLASFANLWTDLTNLKLKDYASGKTYDIGGMISSTGKKIFDTVSKTKVNIDDVDNNIAHVIHNDFPRSHPFVRVYDIKSLYNMLNKQRKLDGEIISKFKKAENDGVEYAVTLLVGKNDVSYDEYSKEKVAEIFTRAFGDALKLAKFRRIDIKPDDLILIDGYESEYKTQSQYDRTRGEKSSSSTMVESYSKYDEIVNMLFESSSDVISVDFRVKNPSKKGAIEKSFGVLTAHPGEFDEDKYPQLSSYDGYSFDYWNPDPNEVDENRKDKRGNPIPNVTRAEFKQDGESEKNKQSDLYILLSKNLVSQNRKAEQTQANDGTTTSMPSSEPFKKTDFQR